MSRCRSSRTLPRADQEDRLHHDQCRSFAGSDLDNSQAMLGMLDMLTASIGSSIDRATFSTSERIRNLLIERFRGMADDIDREARKPRRCATSCARSAPTSGQSPTIRSSSPSISTPSAISAAARRFTASRRAGRCRHQLDGLNVMGEALLAQNPGLSQGPAGGQCAARPALRDGRAGPRRSRARRLIAALSGVGDQPVMRWPPLRQSFRISGRKARPWPGRSGGAHGAVSFEGSTGSIQRSSFQSMYSR